MNERDIKALRWEGKDKKVSLGDCLYLNIRKVSKTYLLIKRGHFKSSTTTLGRVTGTPGKAPEISLKGARQKAVAQLNNTAVDISTVTVETLVNKYWKEVSEPVYKRPGQAIGYFDHIKIQLGRKKVKDIRRSELVDYIQNYSIERGARSSDRLRSYLKMVFSYGVELGFIESSPMSEVSKRITGYIYSPRKRILTNDEIIWLFADEHHHRRALRFLLLTGLRVGEMWAGYQDGDKWHVDDTKGKHSKDEKRPHWVYLTDTAKACLPIKKVSNECLQHWVRYQQEETDRAKRWTPHDCRRTYTTLANDSGILPHVVEKCLNHKMEGVMAVYNYAEYEPERIECAKVVERVICKKINQKSK